MKRLLLVLLAACGSNSPSGSEPEPEPEPEPVKESSAREPDKKKKEKPTKAKSSSNPILAAHNAYRKKHCAPELVWDEKLEKMAQAWADRCEFEHSRTKYGENLAAGTHGALPAERVVEMWYEEIAGYDFKRGGFSMETGHFTQVVWKGTTRLGCAVASCPQWDLWVCNYDPPGNVERGYGSNVLSTGCK